jgi:DNA replication protein DnaC
MKKLGDVIGAISIPITPRSTPTPTSGQSGAEVWRCPLCKDLGYVRMSAPVGDPNFGRLIECECRRRERDARESDDLRRLSNLDAMLDLTFANFDRSVPGARAAYDAAWDYAQNTDGWLLLQGPCGVGKTHLAVAIALHAMQHQHLKVLFAVVPDLLDHLRSTFDPSAGVNYDERFQQVRNAPLLVLDDLGTENATAWAREKLYQIFNHRYNERLPTIITTNQDLRRIEERVLSRLLDTRLTRLVEIDAEDFRRRDRPSSLRPLRR